MEQPPPTTLHTYSSSGFVVSAPSTPTIELHSARQPLPPIPTEINPATDVLLQLEAAGVSILDDDPPLATPTSSLLFNRTSPISTVSPHGVTPTIIAASSPSHITDEEKPFALIDRRDSSEFLDSDCKAGAPIACASPDPTPKMKTEIDDSDSYRKSAYECDECGRRYKLAGSFRAHCRFHDGSSPFWCKICPQAHTTRARLELHMNAHDGRRPYKCSFCNFACTRRSNLVEHERTHAANTRADLVHACADCQQRFETPAALTRHRSYSRRCVRQSRHNPIGVRQAASDDSTSNLSRPNPESTGGDTNATANPSKAGEMSHRVQRRVKSEHAAASCIATTNRIEKQPDSATRSPTQLRSESPTATTAKRFDGPTTTAATTVKRPGRWPLKFSEKHVQPVAEPPPKRSTGFECQQCGQRFARSDQLNFHFRRHTGRHPYWCFICAVPMRRPELLAHNKQMHAGKRSFRCAK